jgi:hypothetical protein
METPPRETVWLPFEKCFLAPEMSCPTLVALLFLPGLLLLLAIFSLVDGYGKRVDESVRELAKLPNNSSPLVIWPYDLPLCDRKSCGAFSVAGRPAQ